MSPHLVLSWDNKQKSGKWEQKPEKKNQLDKIRKLIKSSVFFIFILAIFKQIIYIFYSIMH